MNDDLSGDEFAALFFSVLLVIGGWSVFRVNLRDRSGLGNRLIQQRLPLYALLAGLGILFLTLKFFADHQVRENWLYIFLFMVMGLAWVIWSCRFFPLVGFSLREDVFELRNPAAVIALSGAILGVLLAFSGGNIGEGPTIWTTVFASLLATAGFFICWLFLEIMSRVSLAVTEERDVASGWRLAGCLVANGLILGRAVAGNWQSSHQTEVDFFHFGWPALVLTTAAILLQRKWRPTLQCPVPPVRNLGQCPASLFLAAALIVLIAFGKWK